MKKIFTLLITLVLLASCANNSSDSSNDSSDSTNTSQSSGSTDSGSSQNTGNSDSSSSQNGGGSSDSGSNSSSETPDGVLRDIAEIKTVAATFKNLVNNRGVYTSTIKAEITAQLLTLQAYGTTMSGYNGEFKAFVANNTGTISINLSKAGYDSIQPYKDLQQVYTFSGVVGLYNDEVEIDMGSTKQTFHDGMKLDYDFKEFAVEETSIDNLRSTLLDSDFKFNVKGTGWKQEIYKMNLQYVRKVVNATALFSDGTNVIEVHGHDRINGSLSIGRTYTVYGRPGLFNFRPELEHIHIVASDENVVLSFEDAPKITAEEIFTFSYENDDKYLAKKNLDYAGIVNNVYRFDGYVNYYLIDGKYYLLLEDTPNEYYYSAAKTAYDAKALSIKNDESVNRTGIQIELYSPFADFYQTEDFISVYLTPHSYSKTNWDVFVLTNPIAVE